MNSGQKPFVTLVSGLPRSGTSMMMQMLEAGGLPILADHLRSADEENPKGYYELEAVKQTKNDACWLEEAAGKVVKVIYLLLYDLPSDYRYRVLFMRRNPTDVVRSQQKMLQRRGETGSRLDAEQLADVFVRQLAKVDQWLEGQAHFDVVNVDYHEVLNNPLAQAKRIVEFLGTELEIESMARSVDPDLCHHGKG